VADAQDRHRIPIDLVANDVRVHDDELAQIVPDRTTPVREALEVAVSKASASQPAAAGLFPAI
jgi:hypothetical protein